MRKHYSAWLRSTHKSLAGRIHRILKSQCVNPRSGLRWTLAAALLTTCVGLGIAFAQTSVRDPHEPNSPSQKESENKLDRATLTGKVHDRQGKPVPDAKIMLYRIVGSRFQPLLRRAELLEQRRSSDDGTFSIVVPNKRDQGCIIVQKEGLAIGGADWWMGEDSKCDILLDRPEELTGYVVDENDRPVVDAQVSIVEGIIRTRKHRERVDYLSWPVSSCMDVKTDENGRFTFRNLPAESRVSLRVRKAGLATVQDDYGRARLSPGQSEVKLVMPPEASVKGIVRNRADGRPMPDIRVVAVPMMAWPSPEEQFRSVAAVSAGDGGFRIGGLPAIRYTIQLEPPVRGMAEWVAEPVDVSLAAGETIDGVELELMKGGVLEVLVTDSTTGKPIDNAEILVTDSERQQYPSLESCTDSTGVARFRVLPGDHAVQTVDAGTYNRQWHDQISVADGQTRQFVLALIPYSKIAGVVRDPDGNPLKGVELGVSGSGLTESSVVTDANGRFELSWVAGDIDINTPTGLIVARDAERNLATAVQIDSQTRSLNLKLEPGVTLTGRILSFEGTPLVNAAVVVLLHESDAFFDANLQWTFTAAANGSFEVKALPAGQQYEIRAYAKGHGDGVVLVDNQSVSNNHFDVGTIKPPRANLSVSGVVVDSDGLPVTGVDVAYCRKNGRPVSLPETPFSRTDSEGKFTINGVWEGPIHLAVLSHSGFHIFADLDTHGGATDVKIVAAGHSSAGRSQADGGEQVSLLPDWRPRFNEIYHLADGEILKRIAPPFIPERMEYCRNEYDHHEAEPYQLISRWDEQLEPMRMAWGPEGLGTLSNVLEDVLELKTYEYDGPQSLLDIELPGDWIVRDKASQEVKLRAFERLLAREFQRAIQFERRLVERSAIVATGKFKFHPPVGTSDNTSVHLYVTDADSDMISDIGTANSLDEFLRAIGGNLNMPLINRTEPQGRVRISYRCHTYVAQAAGIPNEQLREKFWRTVLDHLTEQTELQFEIRTEPVPVWQVIELAE
jgi:protocatechuate 3,4-dioxygenase beta subunit